MLSIICMKTQAHTHMYIVFICMYFSDLSLSSYEWMFYLVTVKLFLHNFLGFATIPF